MTDADELVIVTCPRCGREQHSYDGHTFHYCPACSHCTHPSLTSDGEGRFVCDLCGLVPKTTLTLSKRGR